MTGHARPTPERLAEDRYDEMPCTVSPHVGTIARLRSEIARLTAALAEAEDDRKRAMRRADKLLGTLPKCAGEWLSGSGGHIKLGPCGRFATWEDENDMYRYACDKHKNLLTVGGRQPEELNWAEFLRALIHEREIKEPANG